MPRQGVLQSSLLKNAHAVSADQYSIIYSPSYCLSTPLTSSKDKKCRLVDWLIGNRAARFCCVTGSRYGRFVLHLLSIHDLAPVLLICVSCSKVRYVHCIGSSLSEHPLTTLHHLGAMLRSTCKCCIYMQLCLHYVAETGYNLKHVYYVKTRFYCPDVSEFRLPR